MAKQPDISKSGFAAISPKSPSGPLARKQLVRNPDGSVTLQYIDNDTGQVLPSLQGYNLVEASNYLQLDDLGLDPIKENDEQESTAATIKKPLLRPEQDSNPLSESSQRAASRGAENNYGYINKPAALGFASALPGPLGLAGKAVNMGINAMNTASMNEARSMMGVPKQSFMQNIGSTVRDKHGQIGDAKITTPQGVAQYPVGFEAQDKYGRTNMTPQEAALRARANESQITMASRPETRSSVEQFQQTHPEQQGIISRAMSAMESFIDNVFGGGDSFASTAQDYSPQARSSTPSAHSIERERDTSLGDGYSPQAQAAIDRGGGGLY